jgi:hypothetical protein
LTRLFRLIALTSALIATALQEEQALASSEIGTRTEIRQTYETSSRRDDESSGSSSGHTTLVERVIAERNDGLELEFDLPPTVTATDRARQWQFPARVFRSADGSLTLLDQAALVSRLTAWLNKAKIDRRTCGTWYFTWNALKVECDPNSVLETIGGYDIRASNLVEGQLYGAKNATAKGPLKIIRSSPGEISLGVNLELDVKAYRRGQAESDVVVAQITGNKLTLDEATRQRANDKISGTVKIQIDLDAVSQKVVRRTTVTHVQIRSGDNGPEDETSKVIVERRVIR